jgi:lipoprotein-anchoring transpeptidase ErfK/SrfK
MKVSLRKTGPVIALAILVVAVAVGGYFIVHTRAHSSGTGQTPVALRPPSPSPGGPQASPSPMDRWMVGKATKTVVAYTKPSASAKVKISLPRLNVHNFPTLVLVHSVKTISGVPWYDVWLPMPPNGSRGWVKSGSLAFYPTRFKIEVDLSLRKLTVWGAGQVKATFRVGVGGHVDGMYLPTPTGSFYVVQKLRSPDPSGPYGPEAMGTSAYQPKLSSWPEGGVVGIHGTNEPYSIGRAITHGCIRLYDKDIVKLVDMVPAGSPIIIHQ